jgi:hypothetical protein
VPQPASNTSAFAYHNAKGRFSLDLTVARVPSDVFRRYVLFLSDDSAPAAGGGTGPVQEPGGETSEGTGEGEGDEGEAPPATATKAPPPPPPPAGGVSPTPRTTIGPSRVSTSVVSTPTVVSNSDGVTITYVPPDRPNPVNDPTGVITKTVIITMTAPRATPSPTGEPNWDDDWDGWEDEPEEQAPVTRTIRPTGVVVTSAVPTIVLPPWVGKGKWGRGKGNRGGGRGPPAGRGRGRGRGG